MGSQPDDWYREQAKRIYLRPREDWDKPAAELGEGRPQPDLGPPGATLGYVEPPPVSNGTHPGAWVMLWVWVPDPPEVKKR